MTSQSQPNSQPLADSARQQALPHAIQKDKGSSEAAYVQSIVHDLHTQRDAWEQAINQGEQE